MPWEPRIDAQFVRPLVKNLRRIIERDAPDALAWAAAPDTVAPFRWFGMAWHVEPRYPFVLVLADSIETSENAEGSAIDETAYHLSSGRRVRCRPRQARRRTLHQGQRRRLDHQGVDMGRRLARDRDDKLWATSARAFAARLRPAASPQRESAVHAGRGHHDQG